MGGRKIDDHKFFAGSGSPEFPKGVHTKKYKSADSAGDVSEYEDTTEMIEKQQENGEREVKKRPLKSTHRN